MDRPFVYVNMAMTVDGKITSASREYPELGSDEDRRNMDRLRAEADAVLIGAGTLRADDPPLHVRDPEMQRHRRALGRPAGLLNVLVTASLEIDPGSKFFAGAAAGRIVATVEDAPAAAVAALESRAEVWRIGRGQVVLGELLARLRQRGIERLLVEGGGELNWNLFREGLVDELNVTICPALLGGRDAPTLLEGRGHPMDRRERLRLLELRRHGDELFCRYAVVRSEGAGAGGR